MITANGPRKGRRWTPSSVAFGQEIRFFRKKKKWGVRELGRRVGVLPSTISNWESGYRNPSPELLGVLIGTLGVVGPDAVRLRKLYSIISANCYVEPAVCNQPPLLWSYEDSAAMVIEWSPLRIPEDLRCDDYSEALLGSCGVSSLGELQKKLAFLESRNAVEKSNRSPRLYYIGSHALTDRLVDPRVLQGQVSALLNLSSIGGIYVQVISEGMVSAAAADGFTYYKGRVDRAAKFPDFVVLRGSHSYTYIGDSGLVCRYAALAKLLRKSALSIEKSRDFLIEKADRKSWVTL